MELTKTMTWMFVALFGIILVIYGRNMFLTIRFLTKEKPKTYQYKWKVRFPLFHHLRLTMDDKHKGISVLIIVAMFGLFYFLQHSQSNQTFPLLVITFLFACVMLAKEFSLRYYVTGSKLIVWSVYPRAYPYKYETERTFTYRTVIDKSMIERIEETPHGYKLFCNDKTVTFVYVYREEKKKMDAWLHKKTQD